MSDAAPQIAIIDEDPKSAATLSNQLIADGYGCRSDLNAENISAHCDEVDVVVTEYDFKTISGQQLISELHQVDERLPIIVLTRQDSSEAMIEATKAGAYDYLLKPVDLSELREVLGKAVEDSQRMSRPVEVGKVFENQDTIVGKSRAMRQVYRQLGQIAAQPVTVLIRGETGTGKELIARAIYQHGHRAHKPFIAVNCAAIPENLLESELFGHERGSFTGAEKTRVGRFEQAHNGTLFLDEIGDLDSALQAKLLRVLQEKTIQRVGSSSEIPVDVRVIAATHRNLERMVIDGTFREDLFYRFNVAALDLPPLRERRDDIPLLIDYFLDRFGREFGIRSPSIHAKAVDYLTQQDWPGNIRQLQNVIRKALLATRGYTIGWQECRNLLKETEGNAQNARSGLKALVSQTISRVIDGELEEALPELNQIFEKEIYAQIIERSGGNQAQAARWLGVSRYTLREKLRQYGLHPGES